MYASTIPQSSVSLWFVVFSVVLMGGIGDQGNQEGREGRNGHGCEESTWKGCKFTETFFDDLSVLESHIHLCAGRRRYR
jgi:hypothetical protein